LADERASIRMDDAELAAYLADRRILTVASHSADGTIHLVPMWFVPEPGGSLAMWTNARSQKAVNLRRDPRVTALAESGEDYFELRGVSVVGRAELVEGVDAVLAIGRSVAERYSLDAPPEFLQYQATKRVGIRIVPERITSWDHAKLSNAFPPHRPPHLAPRASR
jgi:PPOX class probable F420-dependent enzyme